MREGEVLRFILALAVIACVLASPLLIFLAVPFGLALILWFSALAIRRFIRWCFGFGLTEPNEHSEKGISEGMAAFGFILTQVIAASVSQIGKTSLWSAPAGYIARWLSFYLIVSFAVLGALVGMIQSTTVKEASKVRTFDRGSLRFMRFVLGWGLFFGITVPAAALLGWLPTNAHSGNEPFNEWSAEATKIKPFKDPEERELQPDDLINAPVVRVNVPIAPRHFAEGMPEQLVCSITTLPSFTDQGWRIIGAALYIGDPERGIKHKTPLVLSRNIGDRKRKPATLFDITIRDMQQDQTYVLGLIAWKQNATEGTVEEFAKFLNKEKEKALSIHGTWTKY